MIKVIEPIMGMEFEYSTVEDFVYELMTDNFLEGVITDDYGYLEIPISLENGETINYGAIIRKFATKNDWERIRDSYANYYVDEIEDNICNDGETYEFYGYLIREEI